MKPWTNPKEEESAIDTFIQSLPNEEMVLITFKELIEAMESQGISVPAIFNVAEKLGFNQPQEPRS